MCCILSNLTRRLSARTVSGASCILPRSTLQVSMPALLYKEQQMSPSQLSQVGRAGGGGTAPSSRLYIESGTSHQEYLIHPCQKIPNFPCYLNNKSLTEDTVMGLLSTAWEPQISHTGWELFIHHLAVGASLSSPTQPKPAAVLLPSRISPSVGEDFMYKTFIHLYSIII